MQYFYIVVCIIAGNEEMCKVGLNPYQLTEWGRRLATIHPERTYMMFRQPITQTGFPCFYRHLPPLESKVSSKDTFDWNAFEAHKGADLDVDVTR